MVSIASPRKHSLREIETERYILSTLPTFYADLSKKDGTSFISQDGYGHLATVTGATWGMQGRTFVAADRISVTSPLLDFSSAFTIVAWAKPTTLSGDHFLLVKSGGAANYNYGIYYRNASNDFRVLWDDGTGSEESDGGSALTINNSYMLTGVFTGSRKQTYINDQLNTDQAATKGNPVANAGIAVTVGGKGTTVTWLGLIGEVWLFTRALSLTEIQRLYHQTKWRY